MRGAVVGLALLWAAIPLAAATRAPPLRVFVHFEDHAGGADLDAAIQLSAALVGLGYDVVELRPVKGPTRAHRVRYFHRDLSDEAGRLARDLRRILEGTAWRGGVEIQDFTRRSVKTAPGTVELWVAQQGGG